MNFDNLTFVVSLLVSICTLVIYFFLVNRSVNQLPCIDPSNIICEKEHKFYSSKISIIIPAFNEENNIEECVNSALNSTQLPPEQLEVWVIDDQSTDRTLEILQTLQKQRADSRLKIISGLPRPETERWTGKNWACHQGVKQAKGDFLLFIDADVRLQPKAISAVVQGAIDKQLDFLTCVPTIVCGSLIEWLVQPLMFINLLVSFNSRPVKNPKTKTTYALGPFLLFRASVYYTLGGHQAVSAKVAEDVAFARLAKMYGFKIQQFLGKNLATLRMYRNWHSLWEGWTKVLYVGTERSISLMLFLGMIMLLIYTVPWIGLVVAITDIIVNPSQWNLTKIGLPSIAIMLQYWIRQQGSQALGTSTKYWWLQSAGGIIIAVLAIASIIKTETGWGWTWRGRKLE